MAVKDGVQIFKKDKEEYAKIMSVEPAFFFPPHLYRSKHSELTDGFWDDILASIDSGSPDLESIHKAMRVYPERIICAASLMSDIEKPEDGIVVMLVSIRHHSPDMNDVLDKLEARKKKEFVTYDRDHQGFVNQFGVFRSRKAACAAVRFHKQELYGLRPLLDSENTLFSEHLY